MADHFSATRIHRAATLAFAILPGAQVLTLHGMLSDAVQLGRPQVLLIYYSGFIGMAFSMAFFAPLWGRLPLSTEGEFLLWRFNGPWAKRLHFMRSALMGLVVIPILLCLLLLPLKQVLTDMVRLDHWTAILVLAVLLVAGAAINSFGQRMRIDRLIGVVVVALTVPLLILSIRGLRAQDTPPLTADWRRWLVDLSAVDVLAPVLVLWWFASIIDLPSMTGQKLLASRTTRAASTGAIMASAAKVLIGGIFLALPLAIGYTPDKGGYFIFMGSTLRGGPWFLFVVAFYLSSGLFLLLNLQHWAGALIDGNLIKHHVPVKRNHRTAILAMLLTSTLGFLWLFVHDHTLETFWDQILITAGVGPVFILRWYLPRVTALVQFTAMIAAIVYAVLWRVLVGTGTGAAFAALCSTALGIPTHLLQVGVIGIATLATAAVPYGMATAGEIAHGRERLRELHGERPRLKVPFLIAIALCLLYLLLAIAPVSFGMMR